MNRRTLWIILSVWCGVSAALFAGLVLTTNSANAKQRESDAPPIVFRTPKEHPVTSQMLAVSASMDAKPAPDFLLNDAAGKRYSLKELSANKPLVLFFIETQCPCCKGAKQAIDEIQKAYKDRCQVVGIINANPLTTEAWNRAVKPEFPVLCDPEMQVIRAYKAERGVYTTLISPGGNIAKAYPGYSQSMLKELGEKVAAFAGVTPRKLDISVAPKGLTSGCIFPGEEVPLERL